MTPAETASRTGRGLRATRAQSEWEALTVPLLTVLLDIDDVDSIDLAVQSALRLRAWQRMPDQLASFVQSRRDDEAARIADLLADWGFPLVFVIVPLRPV